MDYTSPWAGAHYRPIPGTTAQAKREASQGQRTYEQFKTLSASEPDAGIKFIEGIEYLENPPAEYLDKDIVDNTYCHLDEFRVLDGSELPAGVRWGARYTTFVVNSPVYCAFLLRKIVSNGGRTKECTLSSLEEAFSLDSHVRAVVNCSGRGFGDPKSFIIRGMPCSCLYLGPKITVPGQTCLVQNPCSMTLTRQNDDGSWSFCVPRPLGGGTIIGGTKQPNDWDPNPSPETRAKVLEDAARWFPFAGGERKFNVIRDIVGRRPAREGGMRIEAEKKAGNKFVFHAYGAGGRGFELSRGAAEDVGLLMFENGVLRQRASL